MTYKVNIVGCVPQIIVSDLPENAIVHAVREVYHMTANQIVTFTKLPKHVRRIGVVVKSETGEVTQGRLTIKDKDSSDKKHWNISFRNGITFIVNWSKTIDTAEKALYAVLRQVQPTQHSKIKEYNSLEPMMIVRLLDFDGSDELHQVDEFCFKFVD